MKTPFGEFVVIAHRGAQEDADENTVAAAEDAIRLGACPSGASGGIDGIEFDIHLNKVSGTLYVFHDDTLERMTGDPRSIATIPPADLRKLRTRRYRSQIASLEEMLDAIADALSRWSIEHPFIVNVELKGAGTGRALAQFMPKLLQTDPGWARMLRVSSFDERELLAFRYGYGAAKIPLALLPEYPLWVLRDRIGVDARYPWPRNIPRPEPLPYLLEPVAVHVDARTWTGAEGAVASELPLQVLAYTVNDPGRAMRLRALGVHGIFTDFPSRFK